MANGIIKAYKEAHINCPMVIRLEGKALSHNYAPIYVFPQSGWGRLDYARELEIIENFGFDSLPMSHKYVKSPLGML